MQTSYIYSVSRVNALAQFLLSKTDVERLLVAEPGTDLQSALKETYLAPYLLRVPGEDLALAIEQTLIDAKRLIHKIAPDGDMLRVLWVQYDIHNLRAFAKATAEGLSYEDCVPFLSQRGIYDPAQLYKHVEESSLSSLQEGWQAAYKKATEIVATGDLSAVDAVFDELYFATSEHIVSVHGDAFMQKYLSVLVDLYNLKSRLRHLKNETVQLEPQFVSGGTFGMDQIETREDVYGTLARFGGAEFWKDAITHFSEEGNFTRIDAAAADYLLRTAKEGSADMFSSASLVFYYLKCRQAAANVRAIVVGKNNSLPIDDIRANLRMAYVND